MGWLGNERHRGLNQRRPGSLVKGHESYIAGNSKVALTNGLQSTLSQQAVGGHEGIGRLSGVEDF